MRHHLSEIIQAGHRFLCLFFLAFCVTSVQAQIELKFDLNNRGDLITEDHYGIFYEEINHAGDGGLYAELVRNRSFEEDMDKPICWSTVGNAEMSLTTDKLLNAVQLRALKVNMKADNAGVRNEGYWGINIVNEREYDLSFWLRAEDSYNGNIVAELQNANGQNLGRATISIKATQEWQKYTAKITATGSDAQGYLSLKGDKKGVIFLDVVSLFPPTFKGRKNGCRPDLAQMLADMHPRFMRFPGGCYIEGSWGDGQTNRFEWKKTIGPIEERPGHVNRNWDYKVTDGQGYHEYLELAEDLGANAMFVVNMGIGHDWRVDENDIDPFIQEALDAIEYANGSTETYYGRLRAQNGHPEPFNLKYLGLGNEDIISTVFEERYEMICKAVRERYPDIKICGTVGPFHSPSADYTEGWDFTKKHPDLQYMVDEHYYESTGWFMHNRDYYDSYDRTAAKVYLGEWAASTNVKRPNVETALAEALYLTDIERNGDVVEMTSYAPMLSKDGHSNWNPDMIYFSNTHIRTTPAYEIQRLFSVYGGDRYIKSQFSNLDPQLSHRIGASVVRDSKTGKRYLKLVNALPSTLKIHVEGINLPATVKCQQFTGAIDDQKAKTTEIETNEPTTLPPYSLRVIEL